MLVGIDLGRVWRSTPGQRIRRALEQAGMKKMSIDSGFGFISDVERVLVSTPGESKGKAKSKQPPVVIAIQGKYDAVALRKDLLKKGAARFSYRGAEIFRRGSRNDMVVALLNSQTMLMGDGPSIKAAMDLHGSAKPSDYDNALMRRAVELDGLYDVWFASEVSPMAVAEGALGNKGPAALFAGTDAFEGGVSFAKGLAVDFAFRNKTAADAEKMAAALNMMVQLGAASSKDAEMDGFLEKLAIRAADVNVHLTVAWDEKQVAAGLDMAESRVRGGPMAAVRRDGQEPGTSVAKGELRPRGMVLYSPLPSPAPMTIRIFNAEGGPREVPLR